MNTWLTDRLQLLADQWLTSAYNGHGILGADVPSTGVDGPPAGYADLELPADAAAEVRWAIRRWPTAGTLTFREESSFFFTGAPPGRYYFDLECFRDSRSYGVKRVFLLVGPQPTLIEQLVTAVAVLATKGTWYSVSEAELSSTDGDRFPFLTVQRVANAPNVGLGGASDLQNTRVQIDIHARHMSEIVSLQQQVQQIMDVWSLQNVPLSQLDLFEEATRTYRCVMDYSIWSYS